MFLNNTLVPYAIILLRNGQTIEATIILNAIHDFRIKNKISPDWKDSFNLMIIVLDLTLLSSKYFR